MPDLTHPAPPAPASTATNDLGLVRRPVEHVPDELKTLNAWVLLHEDPLGAEPFIVGRDGEPAYADQPDTWLDFNEATELLAETSDCRLGFALSPDNDYTAIEWPATIQSDGKISPPNRRDWIHFIGSYTEITNDQKLLTIVKGRPPDKEDDGPSPYDNLDLSSLVPEIHMDAGFVTVTGEVISELETVRRISDLAGRLLRGLADDPLTTVKAAGAKWQTTEGWAARFFISSFGDDLRYCVEEDSWYCWDGKRWRRDDIDQVYTEYWGRFLSSELKTFINLVPDVAIIPGDDINDPQVQSELEEVRRAQTEGSDHTEVVGRSKTARQMFRAFVTSLDNHNKCRNVLSLAAKHAKVLAAEFDARPDELNLANGILNLRTSELKQHDPGAMHSRLVDIRFDPDATCPRFMDFLHEVCADGDGNRRPDIEKFVQLALGYSCLGTVEAQVFFILIGAAGCGKSTLVEFIQEEILGEYGTQVSKALATRTWNSDENRFQKANLKGRRMALIPETDDGSVLNAATVKEITTKRKLSAEVKHKDDVNFDATHTLWICSNHLPLITDNDAGTFRRMRPIPFENKIPIEKQDRQLVDKLREERAGVLAWLVRGAQRYAADSKSLDLMPAAAQTVTDNYQFDSDPMAEWTGAYMTVHEDGTFTKDFVYSADVYAHYKEWADIQGIEPKKKQTVSKYLNTVMKLRDRYSRGPNGNDNGWTGVTIKRATYPNRQSAHNPIRRWTA